MTDNPHPVDFRVGARVRRARLALEMSQEQLADKLGLTFQQVQKYEKGKNRISCSRLVEISAALERPIPWFFDESSTAPADPKKESEPDAVSKLGRSAFGMALAEAVAGISNRSVKNSILVLASEAATAEKLGAR